jgi:signal transduction histidine kinase/DNA-binding response OmpR family regulator
VVLIPAEICRRCLLAAKGSVLIIDDEQSVLEILEQYLMDRGYDVAVSPDGAGADALLADRSFDVALVDLKLPDCSGLDLISKYQIERPSMKCVIMTAFASLDSTIDAIRLNVFDYIQKPFDLVKIGEVVDAAYASVSIDSQGAVIPDGLEKVHQELIESREDLKKRVVKANEDLGQARDSLNRHVTRLRMLFQMGRDISSNENWSDALDRFLMALCKYMEADGSALLLFSFGGKVLQVRTSYNMEMKYLQTAVNLLVEAQKNDNLQPEIFSLDSFTEGAPVTCLASKTGWSNTTIPLLYKGRWLGFLLLRKKYPSKRDYIGDYHFLTTIQTILTEEVANAVNISNLRNLKDFNETILENINNGVLKTDRSGEIVFMNGRAREILRGRKPGKLRFDELFANPYGKGSLFEYLLSDEDRNHSLDGVMSIPGGGTVPVRLNSTLVESDEYNGKSLVVVFEDLTTQKAMEEELRRADRLRSLGELSAGVAHEIRNPLTGIATTAQVLREQLDDDGEKIKYINVILEEIRRLDGIITSLLQFARPLTPRPSELSMNGVIDEAVMLVSDKAEEAGVEISVETALEDDGCFLDRDQIKQVVLNLVMNAIEACDGGGGVRVRLGVAEDPASIVMLFEDDGCGISGDASDKIYNPFYTTRSDGTGLGLSITRKIIENHGGSITHEGRTDRGTTFRVRLPRKMATAAAGEIKVTT